MDCYHAEVGRRDREEAASGVQTLEAEKIPMYS